MSEARSVTTMMTITWKQTVRHLLQFVQKRVTLRCKFFYRSFYQRIHRASTCLFSSDVSQTFLERYYVTHRLSQVSRIYIKSLSRSDEGFACRKSDHFTIVERYSTLYYASIDYSSARDAAVCVITVGSQSPEDQESNAYLEQNLKIFKDIIPNVCKFAPNSVLLILSKPGRSCYRI